MSLGPKALVRPNPEDTVIAIRLRRHQSVAIACSLALLTLLLPGAASADPEPSGRGAAPSSEPAPDEATARLQDDAVAAGALDTYFDGKTGELVIVGGSGSRQALEAASRAHDALRVRIETTNVSRTDLDAITSRLVTLRSAKHLDGESYRFGFDGKTGKVQLLATAPRSAFADLLDAFPDLLEYRPGGPFIRASRSNDLEPHWGGSEISDGEVNCASGYTVKKTSTGLNYQVSAGHCASNGEAITQPDTGLSYGTVKFKAAFPANDALLIGGETFAGRVYMGGEAGVPFAVSSAGDPALNFGYCFSGTTQNETCGHVVTDLSEQICFPDGCTNNLVIFTNDCALGDSGGPIVIKGDTTVIIRGHIVGFNAGLNESYGHKWSTVRDLFGLTIVTAS
jgi:hypothetical protein